MLNSYITSIFNELSFNAVFIFIIVYVMTHIINSLQYFYDIGI